MENKKGNKMVNKKTNPHGIKTPTSVDEFRRNLEKYYVTIPRVNKESELYVIPRPIPLSKVSSFSDIYEFNEGLLMEDNTPQIIPKITIKKDLGDYMKETDQWFSSYGFFEDESNWSLYNKDENFMRNGNPLLYTLDNPHLREFYMITLGEYCGYVLEEN